MTTDSIYAYQNLCHETVMVSESNLNFTGTWSSSGTYFAESKDVVEYGPSRYLALVDNENVNPTQSPRRGQQAKWSSLVIITQGTHTDDHTVDEAFDKAQQALNQATAAFSIAIAGTNAAASAQAEAEAANSLAYTALMTAWNGTNGVDQAIQIAVAGTNAAQSGIATALAAAGAALSSANAAQSTATGARTVADAAFAIAVSGTNAANVNAHERTGLSYVIDGAGAEIVQGFKGYVEIPFAMWITGWTIVAEQAGSCVVDILKSNGYGGFPTTSSITDNDKPTLNNAQKNQNTDPSAWVRALGQGDLLGFTVLGAGTVQSVTVALSGTRS